MQIRSGWPSWLRSPTPWTLPSSLRPASRVTSAHFIGPTLRKIFRRAGTSNSDWRAISSSCPSPSRSAGVAPALCLPRGVDTPGVWQPGRDDGAGGGDEGPVPPAQVDGDVGPGVAGDEIDDAVSVDVGQGAGADVGKIGLDELRPAEGQGVARRGAVVQRAAVVV